VELAGAPDGEEQGDEHAHFDAEAGPGCCEEDAGGDDFEDGEGERPRGCKPEGGADEARLRCAD
jgi:hypothetical protein